MMQAACTKLARLPRTGAMTNPTYKQPEKVAARSALLERAVTALTTSRSESPLVRLDEFDETLAFVRRIAPKRGLAIDGLEAEAERFRAFHSSRVGSRGPADLKVLYLAGPEPQNDLRVLQELGVQPENVWALERKRGLYRAALHEAKERDLRLRLHRGGLETFFEKVHERFDIVYYDACAPLPGGKPDTVQPLLRVFHHERLATTSCLVTNFAEVQDDKARRAHAELMRCFYGPRVNDLPEKMVEDGVDPAVGRYESDHIHAHVVARFDDCYSDFLTRFVVDLARGIIPAWKVGSNKNLLDAYFVNEKTTKAGLMRATRLPSSEAQEDAREALHRLVREIGDVELTPDAYPTVVFLRAADHAGLGGGVLTSLLNSNFAGSKLMDTVSVVGLLERVSHGHWDIASEPVREALAAGWLDQRRHMFCDTPLPHLIVNSLFGAFSHPYHANPRGCLRLRYKAKETMMLPEVLVLDQARYFYDYFPPVDLLPSRFRSVALQLVLRACMDRMERHDFSSSTNPFRGAAIAGLGEIPAASRYEFPERTWIGRAPPL